MESVKILIVDDDREIRDLLAEFLETHGLPTALAANGEQMRQRIAADRPDLVVLDLTLPGEDGLALCRELIAGSRIPIIMLTARSAPVDRIVGLEMGADDYLTKPFEPRELVARIRSVLRRSETQPAVPTLVAPRNLRFAQWQLDLGARHLIDRAGTVISLSSGEYRLLREFLQHPNHVLSRDQLLNVVSGRDNDAFDRSIDLQVSRLRQKLGDDARTPQVIKTIRNEGYLFTAAVTEGS